MVTSSSLVAACSIFALSFAVPIRSSVTTHTNIARGSYIMFGGDGNMNNGWPSRKSWLSFDDAWRASLKTIENSCEVEEWGENNSDAETLAIKDSIIVESTATGIPKESKGCVRAPTTHWSHDNPGLMQSARGKGSCNPNGNPISPCPASTIRLMIHDGTNGEGLETTLTQCLEDVGTSDDSKWYKAARLYNAGEITNKNLGIGPTPCYASDIANRLTSPFNWSPCDNAIIGTLSSAQGTVAKINNTPEESTPSSTASAIISPVPAPTTATVAEANSSKPVTDSSLPDLIMSGAATNCVYYFTPQIGDTCASAPVDIDTLRQLNTQLNSECTNLWAGYAYCIAV